MAERFRRIKRVALTSAFLIGPGLTYVSGERYGNVLTSSTDARRAAKTAYPLGAPANVTKAERELRKYIDQIGELAQKDQVEKIQPITQSDEFIESAKDAKEAHDQERLYLKEIEKNDNDDSYDIFLSSFGLGLGLVLTGFPITVAINSIRKKRESKGK